MIDKLFALDFGFNVPSISNFLVKLFTPEFKEFRKGFRPKPSKTDSACADIKASISDAYLLKDLKKELLSINTNELVAVNGKFVNREHNKDYYDYLTKVAETVVSYFPSGIESYNCTLIESGKSAKFGTGFAISLPKLFKPLLPVYKIYNRSGLGINFKLTITNIVGIIDKGYLEEIVVSLSNNSKHLHIITDGARIAQGEYSVVIDQCIYTDDEVLVESFTTDYDREGGIGSSNVM